MSDVAEQQFDVAVIGLGALGAATLWRLAEQGVKAIGIDQFTPPHDLGATHGKTRLFRTFCLEHPVLGDYARLSRRLFQSLEQSSGGSLLSITGGTIIGRPDSQAVSGTLQAAQRLGVQLPVWSSTELAPVSRSILGYGLMKWQWWIAKQAWRTRSALFARHCNGRSSYRRRC
jgi:sarcosine oxidase